MAKTGAANTADIYCPQRGPGIVQNVIDQSKIRQAINTSTRRIRWAGHVARMEEGRGVHKVLVGKPEGKRPLGRPRRRWEDNIKMDLKEVGRTGWGWLRIGTGGGRL